MKIKCGLGLVALAVSVAGTASGNTIIFDDNNGGTAKIGTVERASAPGAGDVSGDPLEFTFFNVSAGYSTSTNLADGSFTTAEIDYSSDAYQDLSPAHGGLGAYSEGATGFKSDTDNLESNLITQSTGDEVLFFDFASAVTLDQVWFNGGHTENVAFSDNGSFDQDDTLFNIFFSEDGFTYTSVFGGVGQQAPIDQEYLFTGLTSAYTSYAIAATGWNSAPGGYIEAIKYSVPESGTLALLGLGLAGLGISRRKKQA